MFILVEMFIISINTFFDGIFLKDEKCYYYFVTITESCFSGTNFKERFKFVCKHNIKQSSIKGLTMLVKEKDLLLSNSHVTIPEERFL